LAVPATALDIAYCRLIDGSINTPAAHYRVVDALNVAMAARGGRVDGAIFHSDRGTKYASVQFAVTCNQHGARRSMGEVGSYDNAIAEPFVATLKRELDVDHRILSYWWWSRGTCQCRRPCRPGSRRASPRPAPKGRTASR
jgi:transposase InsO family protein